VADSKPKCLRVCSRHSDSHYVERGKVRVSPVVYHSDLLKRIVWCTGAESEQGPARDPHTRQEMFSTCSDCAPANGILPDFCEILAQD
jgi:hypothetical protein